MFSTKPLSARSGVARRSSLVPLFLVSGLLFFSCAEFRPLKTPRAVAGVLDLRSWDFEKGPVPLLGEWEFLPGKLLDPHEAPNAAGFGPRDVPDLWRGDEAAGGAGCGGGTYRLKLLLPPGETDLGLRYTTTSTAFEGFANGRHIAGAGHPDLDPRLARPAYRPAVVSLPVGEKGEIELVITASNHEYRSGGLWRPFYIGRMEELLSLRFFRVALAIGLSSGLAAMSIHSLLLFFHRRKERSYLYFGLFSFFIALRGLVTGEYVLVDIFPGIPFDLLIRLEYVSVYLALPSAILFFIVLFSTEAGKVLRYFLLIPPLPFIPLILFAPLPLLTRSINWYYPVSWTCIVGTVVLVLARAALKRKPGGLVLFIASMIVAAATLNDTLYSSFLVSTGNVLPYALVIFILFQDLVLSRRFTGAFDEVEKLSVELRRSNELLQNEVDGHREARERLEVLLAEKETHLKEIHHRVKNSLQLVSSITALQAHRLDDGKTAEALSSLRERIRSISLVHEKLYGSNSSDHVDFGDYARSLLDQLVSGLSLNATPLLKLEIESITVPMDLCVDLGLILSELAMNAFRHALAAENDQGAFSVSISHEGGELVMIVEDNGPGYPPDFSPEKTSSLGFKIVTSLILKREGSLDLASPHGARAEVRVPLSESTE